MAVSLEDCPQPVIGVSLIPRHYEKEALPCKETIEIYTGPERTCNRFECITRKSLRKTKAISAVQKTMKKSSTHSTPCGNCTKCHTPGREHCPAKDSTCHSCQKIGHWKQKCRKSNKAKDAHKKPKSQPQWQHGGRRRADEVGVSEGDPAFDEVMIHA